MPELRTVIEPGSASGKLSGLLRAALGARPRTVLAIAVAQLVTMVAALAQPALNARILDNGVVAGDIGYIRSISVVMLAVSAIGASAAFFGLVAGANLSADSAADLRAAILRQVSVLQSGDYRRIGAHSILARISGDIGVVTQAIFVATSLSLLAPMIIIGAVALSVHESAALSPIIVVTALLVAVVTGVFIAVVTPLATRMQAAIDRVNRRLREQLTGLYTIRAFRRERDATARFSRDNKQLTDLARRVGAIQLCIGPGTAAITATATIATMLWGARLIETSGLTIGTVIAFTGYLAQVSGGIALLVPLVTTLPRARVCAKRIAEVLEAPAESTSEGRLGAPAYPRLTFDNVTVRYPHAESPALDAVRFDCPPGAFCGIAGGTASGKSTLLSLVPRLLSPTSGTVFVSGLPVPDWSASALRGRATYVSGQHQIVAGTVRSNLNLAAPNADDRLLWWALAVAQLDRTVAERGGLDLEVHQGGSNLSGGQRQRLALARALVRRPEILVLDDAFTAMDRHTARTVLHGLRVALRGTTILLGTQQVELLREAATIGVLDHGRLVAVGTHSQLVATDPVYSDLARSQILADIAADESASGYVR